MSYIMQYLVAGTRGGSRNNNPEWRTPSLRYLVNNLKNNYDNIHVSSRSCVDSGCTLYCCGDRVLITDKTAVLNVICVVQPDDTTMWSYHIALLPIPQLLLTARGIHVLPFMKDRWLVSVGQLCDDGFSINFYATQVYLQKRKTMTYRKQILGIRIILYWFWHNHQSTTGQKYYSPLPGPTNYHNWGFGILRTPHGYHIGLGAIPTLRSLEPSTLNLD